MTAADPTPDSPTHDRAALAALLAFFVQGFAAFAVYTRIPDLQVQFALSEARLGLYLTLPALSGVVVNLYAGRLTEIIGIRAAILRGVPASGVLTLLVPLSPNEAVLVATLVALGVTSILTNVAINILADRVEILTGRRVMNRCHGLWSVGFMGGALIGVAARAAPVSPAVHFALLLPPALAIILFIRPYLVSGDVAPTRTRPRPAWPNRAILRLVFFALAGSIAQSAVQAWSVIMMRDTFAAAAWIDTMAIPVFFAALTLGRLISDRWIERSGAQSVGRMQSVVGGVGVALIALAPGPWLTLAAFGLLGFGSSAGFPLMVSGVARLGGRSATENVASATFSTSLMMMAVPAVMGLVAEHFGVRAAFVTLMPAFALAILMARHLR